MGSPSVRQISVDILDQVNTSGLYTDDLIDNAFRQWNLKSTDKSLLTELVNGTIRWRGHLDWILSKLFHGDFNRSSPKLRSILELSLYQIRFLDRIPDYAAVSEGVEMAKKEGGVGWGKLVNGVLRSYQRKGHSLQLPPIEDNFVYGISVRYSHPQWIVRRWLERFGEENTIKYCEYNNKRPDISLRCNLRKISRDELLRSLKDFGIEARPSCYFNDFIKISTVQDLFCNSLFNEGVFTIQDESTAIATLLLSPEEGDVILDMCAAPGGKCCHMAHLLNDKGKIIAADVNMNRVSRLKENVSRLKLHSVQPIAVDSSQIELSMVDKILLDAPCSGLGVLSKRSDLRWRRTLNDITNIRRTQKALLENANNLLRKGGILVYSTCTLEPEETESIVEEFLENHKNFQIDNHFKLIDDSFATSQGYWKSFPFEHDMDGSFAVRLIKIK